MIRPTTFANRCQYLLFAMLTALLVRLPERSALALGSFLGWIAGSLLRIRIGVVRENLALAFPEQSPGWRTRVAAASYRHVGRESVAILRLRSSGRSEVRARCSVEGLDLLEGPLARGRGVVVLMGHLGNWEMGAAGMVASGIPLDVVARRQSNALFDADVRRTREKLGMKVVYQTDAPRAVLRSLRSGRAVVLVADQNVLTGGVFVEFFGKMAATARGPAVFLARAAAEVVMLVTRSLPGPTARYSLRFLPVPLEPSKDADENTLRLLRAYHALLEEAIRAAPEQYFWLHRRWKTRPEAEEPRSGPEVSGEPHRVQESR